MNQTTKQIKERFKEVNLDKYYNVPENAKQFCTMFGLEKDKIVDNIFVIKRHSTAEIYVYLNLPNPSFPECPIRFETAFYASSAKGACSITLGRAMNFYEHTSVFNKVTDIFDERKDYNNMTYDVYMSSFVELNKSYEDWDHSTRYCLKDGKTLQQLYEAICEYVKTAAPLIKMVVESVQNGTLEKLWNTYMPRNKWNHGHEIEKAMFFPVILHRWHRAVCAGLEPNLSDFIKYFAAVNVYNIGNNDEKDPLIEWDSDDKEAVERFKYIVSNFNNKYLNNTAIDDWNKTYVKANKELIDEVKAIRSKLSQKYNINEKYLECYLKLADNPYIKEIVWSGTNVPEDAYVKS